MDSMAAFARAVLAELESAWIVLLVLARGVGPRLALGASELDDGTCVDLCHFLLGNRDDGPGADSAATLADGKALSDFEGDRGDEFDGHVDVVAGHDHLGTVGQSDGAGNVGCTHVELGPIAVVERGVATALFAGQDVDPGHELGVGLDRTRLRENLATLDVVALDTAQEATDVVAGAAFIEQLLEHLDAGDDNLAGVADTDDLDFIADLDDAALDAPRGHGATALDAEDVFDRHQEGLVDGALRDRDVAVDRIHKVLDALVGRSSTLSEASRALRAEPRTIGMSSPGKWFLVSSSRTSSSTSSRSSGSSTASHLLRKTTMYGTST